jgi:hypothetical protein
LLGLLGRENFYRYFSVYIGYAQLGKYLGVIKLSEWL